MMPFLGPHSIPYSLETHGVVYPFCCVNCLDSAVNQIDNDDDFEPCVCIGCGEKSEFAYQVKNSPRLNVEFVCNDCGVIGAAKGAALGDQE
jgi:hypothetical protein